jgi:hypothetical protein
LNIDNQEYPDCRYRETEIWRIYKERTENSDITMSNRSSRGRTQKEREDNVQRSNGRK